MALYQSRNCLLGDKKRRLILPQVFGPAVSCSARSRNRLDVQGHSVMRLFQYTTSLSIRTQKYQKLHGITLFSKENHALMQLSRLLQRLGSKVKYD